MNEIQESKQKHIVKVAEYCYKIAKEKYKLSEQEAKECYAMGYLHDIGYAFASAEEHPDCAFELLVEAFNPIKREVVNAIADHGKCIKKEYASVYLLILNEADMHVDHLGNVVSVEERLDSILKRYGKESKQYKDCLKLVELQEIE